MPMERDTIERLAELSGLLVDSESLEDLAGEINAILEFVSQLGDAGVDGQLGYPEGRLMLHDDEPRDARPIPNPAIFAPEFDNGFFLVPRPESLGEG